MKSSFAAIFRANSAALRSVFTGVFAFFIFSFAAAQSVQTVNLKVTKPAANNGGYNLIGNTRAGTGFTNGASSDQVGGSTTPINPQLFPRGFYGGGTPARRPMSSSPATAPCGTFSSDFGMVIPANAPNGGDFGPASPYPWDISASGLAGTVTKVTVTINHLNHGAPFDIDMLLIGPGGQNAVIMSDVGANLRVNDVTLTLDDAAAAALPIDDFLVDGTFRPTNYATPGGSEFDDIFPGAPVSRPSGASALSVFNGTNPNGTWSLYVRDDSIGAGSTGYINGKWSLSITTTNCSAPVANNDSYTAVEDGTLNVPAAGVLSNDTDAEMSALTATLVSAPANAASFTLGADGSFSYTPLANFNGTDSFTYKANDGGLNSNTATVTITVTEVNDVPIPTSDSKRTNVNTTLVFPATDLTANDSPGPANESAQALTVTSVTATANTHGTVSLNNGQITYQPTTNYSGAAQFNYQVCDNGTTNGQADPKCGSGTVNVTVVPTYALTVTRADDRNNATCAVGDCSLREALNQSGSDGGNDIITFNIPANGANCVGTVCTITLGSMLAPAADSGNLTTINGASGANVITLSGNGATQILNIGSGVNLAADNLNFTRGANGTSGAIGGAIANSGALTLTNSAVYNNSAQNGGGLATTSGSVTNLTNVTISGNSAGQLGGGIYNAATVTTTNCTITNNSAQFEGGVVTFNNTTFNSRNTIIAGNSASFSPDAQGNFTSNGYNIVGNASGANGFNQAGDQSGVDARLAPLGNYGGKTLTHALLDGGANPSPAINAGTATGAPTTDQRGAIRVGNVDKGAFEVNNTPNGGSFVALLPNGSPGVAYQAQIAANNGAFTYSVTSGSLPNGITLNTTNFASPSEIAAAPSAVVALSGTPTQSGTFNFAITTTNGTNSNVTNYRLQILAPTAAAVSVAGRVFAGNRGLMNATVTLTNQNGVTQSARTSSFGYYHFDNVEAGQTYVIAVQSKRFQFAPQVVSVSDDLSELNFYSIGKNLR